MSLTPSGTSEAEGSAQVPCFKDREAEVPGDEATRPECELGEEFRSQPPRTIPKQPVSLAKALVRNSTEQGNCRKGACFLKHAVWSKKVRLARWAAARPLAFRVKAFIYCRQQEPRKGWEGLGCAI